MKDSKDLGTVEISEFPMPPRRGRRPSGQAKTGAQRQAEWRAKHQAEVKTLRDVVSSQAEIKVLRDRIVELECVNAAWREMHDRQLNEMDELRRVISCLKTEKRPCDLTSKG